MDAAFDEIRSALRLLQSVPIERGDFAAESHQYRLNSPLSEEDVRRFEVEFGIELPPDYRMFLIRVGNGGAGPAYGVFKLGEVQFGRESERYKADGGIVGNLSRPFPHTGKWNDYRDQQKYEGPIDGAIPLSNIGCGSLYWLIVTGPETGHVWCDNRADYAGFSPVGDSAGGRMTFLQWYQGWLESELRRRGL